MCFDRSLGRGLVRLLAHRHITPHHLKHAHARSYRPIDRSTESVRQPHQASTTLTGKGRGGHEGAGGAEEGSGRDGSDGAHDVELCGGGLCRVCVFGGMRQRRWVSQIQSGGPG